MRTYRAVALLVPALTLAGCVHGSPPAALPAVGADGAGSVPATSVPTTRSAAGLPSGTAESPITWVLLRPLPAEPMLAVLRGYGAYLDGYVRLYASPDPADPLIAQVSTGVAQQNLVADVRDLAARHLTVRGPITAAPVVTVLRQTVAQVDDCVDLSRFRYVGRTSLGKRDQPIRADLVWVSDRWLVSAVTRPAGICPRPR